MPCTARVGRPARAQRRQTPRTSCVVSLSARYWLDVRVMGKLLIQKTTIRTSEIPDCITSVRIPQASHIDTVGINLSLLWFLPLLQHRNKLFPQSRGFSGLRYPPTRISDSLRNEDVHSEYDEAGCTGSPCTRQPTPAIIVSYLISLWTNTTIMLVRVTSTRMVTRFQDHLTR
jgi:hypothetical protein